MLRGIILSPKKDYKNSNRLQLQIQSYKIRKYYKMKKICVFCGSSKPENHTKLENEVISLGNLILKEKASTSLWGS